MSDTLPQPEHGVRLLGPSHNRLLVIVPEYPDGKRTPGTIALPAANFLANRFHWAPYVGPATTVNGFVVPGSDPNLHPRPLKRS